MIESKQKKKLEQGEKLISSVPPEWLAGFFEIGGWLGFGISTTTNKQLRSYEYAYPRAAVVDNHIPKLKKLALLLGGVVGSVHDEKRNETNNVWTLSQSELVVYLAERMRQYSPSHQETIFAFENWINTDDREERIKIAQELREVEKPDLSIGDYLPLVTNAKFLAGVLDNRGIILSQEHMYGLYGYITPGLKINSTNGPLLEALQLIYGGYKGNTLEKGKTMISHGKEYIVKNNSFEWTVGIQPKSDIVMKLGNQLKLLKI